MSKISNNLNILQSYPGGKGGNGTFQNIINHIPRCDILVEAFAGSAAISRRIKRPGVTVVNDIDSCVYHQLLSFFLSDDVLVSNINYSAVIDKYDRIGSNVFFYLDPPYLFSTRKSNAAIYNHEFSYDDHLAFLDKCIRIKANCMISHYSCDLYNDILSSWRTFDFFSNTRKGLVSERIYMNYNKPNILQDYSYIGQNFSERQQIKRKADRLIDKFAKMGDDERVYYLSLIMDKYGYASAL